jgi:hypothetical protein
MLRASLCHRKVDAVTLAAVKSATLNSAQNFHCFRRTARYFRALLRSLSRLPFFRMNSTCFFTRFIQQSDKSKIWTAHRPSEFDPCLRCLNKHV